MEKSYVLREMASPYSKWNNLNTTNSSPKKRQKVSEETEAWARFDSELSMELNSPKVAIKNDKLNLKRDINLKSNRSMLKKPKKNITAYAFFIKEVCLHASASLILLFRKRRITMLSIQRMLALRQWWSN